MEIVTSNHIINVEGHRGSGILEGYFENTAESFSHAIKLKKNGLC